MLCQLLVNFLIYDARCHRAVIKSKHRKRLLAVIVTSLVKGDSDSALFINHDSLSIIKANDDGAK